MVGYGYYFPSFSVSSQCFLSKNVTSRGLMSIATKVVVQMNAKLGGEPWHVSIPLKVRALSLLESTQIISLSNLLIGLATGCFSRV